MPISLARCKCKRRTTLSGGLAGGLRLHWRSQSHFALHGFTLIELLVVIAIISLLVSILLPSLQKAKDLAKGVVCTTNLRSISIQLQFYSDDTEGQFPMAHLWNYDGWIETLAEFQGEDLSHKMFACPSDDIVRTLEGDKRSYAVNHWLVPLGPDGGRPIESAAPQDLFVIGERVGPGSVIGQPGRNDIWWSGDATRLHQEWTESHYLCQDGHIQSEPYIPGIHYYGSPYWITHFRGQ